MFKLIQFLFLIFNSFLFSPAFSQSLDGLKEIVTIQQEKIARIENNVKNLIGSFESLSNLKSNVEVPEDLESKINSINQKLNLLESNLPKNEDEIKCTDLPEEFVIDNTCVNPTEETTKGICVMMGGTKTKTRV